MPKNLQVKLLRLARPAAARRTYMGLNPRLRRKKPVQPLEGQDQSQMHVSAASLFRKVADLQIRSCVDGNTIKMSQWDAYVRQIYRMAFKGNSRAARLLDQLRRQFPGDLLPGDPVIIYIDEADAKL